MPLFLLIDYKKAEIWEIDTDVTIQNTFHYLPAKPPTIVPYYLVQLGIFE